MHMVWFSLIGYFGVLWTQHGRLGGFLEDDRLCTAKSLMIYAFVDPKESQENADLLTGESNYLVAW